ncbi:uncharacterized protein LOC114246130 isoform X2 [Bombyx mandarina]|uniref:Uncharacterized protein LOC114246130 isoform X2 n=1 Tax=Bombyx mandarina TaxID=7092 RepID=A0A6J2JXN7_BOMMA|nr:uncharacterized protein LOC114246130 isoform X2 [Bombyx mandarina]
MSNTSSNKNHVKKSTSSRDRDKNKSVPSESGSSQCDTPPLNDKDGPSSQGRFAGVGLESVFCMAEQVACELNVEAATNLAEDVSYKLRQTISTIALHSEMMKKSRVDAWDVNTVFMLTDTSPVAGACGSQYASFGDDNKYCCQIEHLLNVTEFALSTQTYVYCSPPTISVEWIMDDKSLSSSSSNISVQLHNYYTKVARAILNLRKKPKEVAVEDLLTNTRIGPIFPNLFNLAVLVLNDDNLNALNVPAKKPLQSNVLDMVDALCSNPCSLDTNIQQQFQRLFPVMVSNILGNGTLAEKMVAILTKITRTWPSFVKIGQGILYDYLSQGTRDRLTAPMIKCVTALGRTALAQCLEDYLDYLDECMQGPRPPPHHGMYMLREAILDASTCLLRSEPTTYLEDYVTTDYTMYEMLGESILPRRLVFPVSAVKNDNSPAEKTEEDSVCIPRRPVPRRPKFRLIPSTRTNRSVHRDAVFEPTKFRCDARISINVRACRAPAGPGGGGARAGAGVARVGGGGSGGAVAAAGRLHRFRYRLNKNREPLPLLSSLML